MKNPTARAARIARPTPCIQASAMDAPLRKLNLRQHVLAETPHVGGHRVGGSALETEIDMANPEIAERPQIGDDIRQLTREQPPLAVIGAIRQRFTPRGNTV